MVFTTEGFLEVAIESSTTTEYIRVYANVPIKYFFGVDKPGIISGLDHYLNQETKNHTSQWAWKPQLFQKFLVQIFIYLFIYTFILKKQEKGFTKS